jgi:hypothetical protein
MGIVIYSILSMVDFMSLLWHWVYCEPYTAFQSINSCRILGAGLNGFFFFIISLIRHVFICNPGGTFKGTNLGSYLIGQS